MVCRCHENSQYMLLTFGRQNWTGQSDGLGAKPWLGPISQLDCIGHWVYNEINISSYLYNILIELPGDKLIEIEMHISDTTNLIKSLEDKSA